MALLIFLSFVLSLGSGSDEDAEDRIAVPAVKKANIRSSNGKNIANFDARKDMKKSDAKKPKIAKQDSMADALSLIHI